MVNERYDDMHENHEEGEYHFSEDQANYDMEMEGAEKDATATVAVGPKESIGEKLKNHRRMVIGILVFVVLLGIVYKLVTPSPSPVTDFQAATNPAATKKISTKIITPQVTTSIDSPMSTQQQSAVAPVAPQPAATITTNTANPSSQIPAAAPVEKNILDRVTTLEQQNNALMSLIQTQYAQKIAENEMQNNQLRTQVQELNARISNMEVAFRQLTKILSTRSTANAEGAPARVIQPKNIYTVQAIIPGRAWLKSESGDTVTVAEGDSLKGLGRIIKIDPYDGVVDIDTGSKTISLSYGANGD